MTDIAQLLNEYTEIKNESYRKIHEIETEIGILIGGEYGNELIIFEREKWMKTINKDDYWDTITLKDKQGQHEVFVYSENPPIEIDGYTLFLGDHPNSNDGDSAILIFKLKNKVENLDD